ncbi:zinc-binding dehydrogenase [Stackebrandtia nassauensis]|uniref:Alcohol dehydrogenase zinc-binding domain protein n=1 Tax=Stackebrandtia nassauensis (strain DSM 44728 / CIP 108903 / NRRL B-16338 / NBRC 102104 / LLR-40K-21) TaxID=446470 RepID=D3QAZ4_STANL|nr:zinc-binding dehydrogenase [Stackebrandtia nassauensis]ADD44790.1 Alcohol dehydrogenase zinc-binding domain protein [Stackebrandtia nassauensis DSM 44728]
MFAAYASTTDSKAPLSALATGERPEPDRREGWTRVRVEAAALNHHDLWSLRGVGLSAEQCPMILGCDAAGVDEDGNDVIVHAVVADAAAGAGDETLDPKRTLLSEKYDGTLAEYVTVPSGNLIPKPAGLSFAEAACLPTAYLTAYRMLTTKGRLASGDAVLVQGAGGGVSTAAILLAKALGARVYASSRDADRRDSAEALGAIAIEPGGRLPERVDVVIESVGAATIEHSLKCAKPGGRIVVCGTTSGHLANVDLRRLFFLQLELLGSTMGTRGELEALVGLCAERELRPLIDSVYQLTDAAEAFARLESGAAFGKIVLTT